MQANTQQAADDRQYVDLVPPALPRTDQIARDGHPALPAV